MIGSALMENGKIEGSIAKMCKYREKNGKEPCCTHDCDGCEWNDEIERNCLICDNSYISDDDFLICELDGRSRDYDQVCEKWI